MYNAYDDLNALTSQQRQQLKALAKDALAALTALDAELTRRAAEIGIGRDFVIDHIACTSVAEDQAKRFIYAVDNNCDETAEAPRDLREHLQYTASDYQYLRDKGYTNPEIRDLWNRDLAQGKAPATHAPIPDLVSYLTPAEVGQYAARLENAATPELE